MSTQKIIAENQTKKYLYTHVCAHANTLVSTHVSAQANTNLIKHVNPYVNTRVSTPGEVHEPMCQAAARALTFFSYHLSLDSLCTADDARTGLHGISIARSNVDIFRQGVYPASRLKISISVAEEYLSNA